MYIIVPIELSDRDAREFLLQVQRTAKRNQAQPCCYVICHRLTRTLAAEVLLKSGKDQGG